MPPLRKKPKKYVQQTLTNILTVSKRDPEEHKYPNKKLKSSDKSDIQNETITVFHDEGLTEAEKVLQAFDLNYKYGPCVGLKRVDRWERARKFGLNPPTEVKELLLTTVGLEESIFHGRV